jgi:YcaO-like protein with predicted kinase domain
MDLLDRDIILDNVEILIREQKIVYRETGVYTLHPLETIARVEPFLQSIGVVKIAEIDPRLTDGIPIFRLNEAPVKPWCHRYACKLALPPTPLNNPLRESFGKGMTPDQSMASAMMEAVERYCGQRFPHSKVIRAGYREVQNRAVSLSDFRLPDLPPKCERCTEREKGCFRDLHDVCDEWTWGYSLLKKRPILIPSAVVYYPYISDRNLSFIYNDTGGLAAGNTIEEAILQGITEVIERDALYYAFNLDHLSEMQFLDLEKVGNKFVNEFLRKVPGRAIFAFHIRNNELGIDIPTFSSFLCYRMGDGRRYFGGSGTSLDPDVALLRALTELEQQKVRQKLITLPAREHLIVHDHPGAGRTSSIEDIPSRVEVDIKKDIETCLEMFSERDMEVVAVDLTHPGIGIPVVRIVIPKLISYSGSTIRESVFIEAMKASGGRC